MAFKDLRTCLEELKRRELLFTITRLIDKDSELMPLVRWQYRGLKEEERRAFLFTNVTDGRGRSYDASVAVAALGASRQVYAAALGCAVEEIRDRWIRAAASAVEPVLVKSSSAPVKEEIHGPEEVKREGFGMDEFPVPISTPGYDPAPFVTSGHWVTKDAETGIRNVGNYRGHVKAPDRLGLQLFPTQHEGIHWSQRMERGQDHLECAIVIGAPPTVAMTAVAKLPYGVDEFAVAGALAGEPIELVQCETVDLEVPAAAEIVIEGRIMTRYAEPEAPFGEFTGFVGERTLHPCFELTCVTHRKRPIWQAFISQFPPSESTKIRGIANEANYYDLLKNHCNVPSVLDVVFHEAAGAMFLVVIRLKKRSPAQRMQALLAAALDPTYGKILIAVDDDVDPYDLDAVMWAATTRMQPHLDVQIIQQRASMLDPSAAHPDAPREQQWYPEPRGAGAMLIDATRKWDYPPVSLPKEEFMLRARHIWEEERLPALTPKRPWYGYPLGPWPAEWEEEADMAVKGRYFETGEKLREQRQRR